MISMAKNLFYHREHTWVRLENSGAEKRFRVGLDEIFLHDLGQIDHLDLPNEGDEISVDEICGVIRGTRAKKMLCAPLTGEIVDVNYELLDNPDFIREDPYGIGWLLLIDPSNSDEELVNLLQGEEARQWWEDELTSRGL